MTYSHRIKIYLNKSGKTQTAFARLCGIKQDKMCRIINAICAPTSDEMKKIDDYLITKPEILIKGNKNGRA